MDRSQYWIMTENRTKNISNLSVIFLKIKTNLLKKLKGYPDFSEIDTRALGNRPETKNSLTFLVKVTTPWRVELILTLLHVHSSFLTSFSHVFLI